MVSVIVTLPAFDVRMEGRSHVAVAQRAQGVSFPLLMVTDLTAVGGEGDDVEIQLVRHRPRHSAFDELADEATPI
jgi:hypothetical protein